MPAKIFKRFFKPKKLNIWLKILLIGNILVCVFLLLAYLSTHVSPEVNGWLPFFGLSFPFFLIPALLFMLIWLFLRNKWFLISFLTILIGFNHVRHFYQITLWSSPLSENSTKIKVMSYNVRLFNLYNWAQNKKIRNNIFAVLKEEDADIYCFQEFYVREDGVFNTRDTMKTFLRAKYVHEGYTHYIPSGKQSFGLATFSAYPIIDKKLIQFSNDNNNCMIVSDIKINEDTIRVINVHLASIRFQKADYDYIGDNQSAKQWRKNNDNEQKILTRLKNAFIKRAAQIEQLNQEINRSKFPIIVCGDFNDTPISYAYNQATTRLIDAFVESGNGTGQTYIGKIPSFRIDYILHSPKLHSYDFKTLSYEHSDHRPIVTMIDWE